MERLNDNKTTNSDQIRQVAVDAGQQLVTFFNIIPQVIGDIPVIVKAYSSDQSDGVKKQLHIVVNIF